MMKITLKLCMVVLFLISFAVPAFSLLNPAEVYCKAMDYTYVLIETELGESANCYFDNESFCDAWAFLKGNCAPEKSYCASKGYEIKTVRNYDVCEVFLTEDCAVCVLGDGTEKEVTELMGLSFIEGTCGDLTCAIGETYENCPQDCPSGYFDGYCDGVDDGICDPDCSEEEDVDCLPVCGNEKCEYGESYTNCPIDCPFISECGNNICEEGENASNCAADCVVSDCGNDICDADENYISCPADCFASSKDDYCSGKSDGICDPDCSEEEDVDCERTSGSYLWLYILIGVLIVVIVFVLIISVKIKR